MPYKDPERAREAALERYARNRETRIAQMRDYYRRHPEAWLRWNKNNPEKVAMINARRRAAVKEMTQEDKEYFTLLFSDPCSYCDKPMTQVDHIVPLAKGGEAGWENLTAACAHCNRSKNASPVLVFMLNRTKAND